MRNISRDDEYQPDPGAEACGIHHGDDEERGEDAEIAVSEVHEAHDPEHEREPGREERVEAPQEDALDDGVDPRHRALTLRSTRSRSARGSARRHPLK